MEIDLEVSIVNFQFICHFLESIEKVSFKGVAWAGFEIEATNAVLVQAGA